VPAERIDARLQNAIVSSIAAGATSLIGGFDDRGALQLPCVLADVHAQMPVAHLDTFDPILSITAFDTDEEAVVMANNCPFGLGASVFARDEAAARAIAARLEAGVVTINDLIVPTADPRVPFGGRKQSGFGVTRGAEGLLAMTQTKVVQLRRGRKRAHFNLGLTNRFGPLFPIFIQLVHGRLTTRFAVFRRLLFGFGK
jgi:acyl-CoA reductase-like NAD-dependent aldehyde dehydrogenase